MEPRRHVLGPVTVSRIGFGAMQLPDSGVFDPLRDRTAAIAVLRVETRPLCSRYVALIASCLAKSSNGPISRYRYVP
jgi:hypothetical protein